MDYLIRATCLWGSRLGLSPCELVPLFFQIGTPWAHFCDLNASLLEQPLQLYFAGVALFNTQCHLIFVAGRVRNVSSV